MIRQRTLNGNRGYLMIDLLIVMTLTVLVLSTMSMWVYKTMQYSSSVKQRNSHSRNISRIGRQLRTDASDAERISIDGNTAVIAAGENRIQYTINTNVIHREATGSGKAHHDDFEFANNATLVWARGSSENVALLNIRRNFDKLLPSEDGNGPLDSQIRISVKPEASR